MEEKTMKAWAADAIAVAQTVASALEQSPQEAAALMAGFAEKVSAEQARREALGKPSLVGLQFSEDVGATMLGQAMESLARQSIALARAGGMEPKGAAWGAFKTFFHNAGMDGKIGVLMDMIELERSGANPAWSQAALGLAQEQGMRWKSKGPASRGEAMRPADPITPEQAAFGKDWSFVLGSPAQVALLSKPGEEGQALAQILSSVATLKGEVAALEARTGEAWRAQHLPKLMQKNHDIDLRSAGFAALDMAQRSGQNPQDNPQVGAGMSALMSMMSASEAKNFCESIKRSRPILGQGWDAFVAKLASKWGVGVAAKNRNPLGKPELLIPSTVPFGQEMAHFAEKFKTEQADLRRRASRGLSSVASMVSAKFVDAFKPAAAAARQEPSLDGAAAPQAPSRQGFSLGQAKARVKAGMESAIDKGNAWTDHMEAAAKARARSAVVASAAALDSVVDGTAQVASAARAKFQGKVGEAKAAVGKTALAMAERVEQHADSPTAQARRAKAAQIATVAGAVFVGVAMAPVAGVLAATVGAVAAGMGFSSALKKAGEAFRSKKAALPPALESLGERLGARREAAAQAPAEPAAPSPGM